MQAGKVGYLFYLIYTSRVPSGPLTKYLYHETVSPAFDCLRAERREFWIKYLPKKSAFALVLIYWTFLCPNEPKVDNIAI